MAFVNKQLQILTTPFNSGALALHSYVTTTDNLATVKAANYFVTSRLQRGEIIMCNASDGHAQLVVDTITLDALETATAVTVKTITIA